MLNIFLGRNPLPEYKLTEPAQMERIIVKEDVSTSPLTAQVEGLR